MLLAGTNFSELSLDLEFEADDEVRKLLAGSRAFYQGNGYEAIELCNEPSIQESAIQHGMVMLGSGRTGGRPARLELTKDALSIQLPVEETVEPGDNDIESGIVRYITMTRQKDGGLGLSVKGGSDVAPEMPVLISKIFKGQSADSTGQLFVGDAIIDVNGTMLEGRTHDDVVHFLREAGSEVQLTVRHYTQMAPYLRGDSRRSSSTMMDRMSEPGTGTWKSSMKARSEPYFDQSSLSGASVDEAPEGFRTLVKIPLPMAYITRYLWGTDKLRSNVFELRAVDGTSSGSVHCEDSKALDQWVKQIQNNITLLNNKSIKMSNKYLHPSELIVYLGWVCERESEGVEGDLKYQWVPRFLILKGAEVCFFESPPLNVEDLTRCVHNYKIYETLFRIAKRDETLDKREHCFWVDTTHGTKHYYSIESEHQLSQLEGAWHRATYYTVARLESKTFACNFEGRPSGLTVDLRQGFMLFDIPTKNYTWKYKFSDLITSADDGKMRLQLIFKSKRGKNQQDIRDMDCAELYPLVYTLHAFYLSRIIGLDPDFLKTANF